MPHPLENLSGPGKPLKAEAPDANEFTGLLRRLGYRAGNRYIVFQVLPHTLGL